MAGIRDLILSLKAPTVFHGKISEWDMLKWNEEKWCNLLGDQPLPFRCGLKKCSRNPQWERTCKTEYMTIREFFKTAQEGNADSWLYFDYKYLNEWLKESQAFKTLSWSKLGFPELTKDECTLWIGSSGAHTPCHMDSYGCNLVAQILGHKQWILFPPSESSKLGMTRVPYEESSVYSALNFNAPIENISDLPDNVYIVTLSPGDVLFVPHHWWHYVENLDMAIAINTWLPLPEDHNCRLDEVLVRFFISQATSSVSPAQLLKIMNPNEDDLRSTELSTIMNQMKVCLENVIEVSDLSKESEKEPVKLSSNTTGTLNLTEISNSCSEQNENSKKRKLSDVDNQDLSNCSASGSMIQEDMSEFKILPKSNVCELRNILDAKCRCNSKEEHTEVMKSIQGTNNGNVMELLPAVINAFCHPNVLETVQSVLLEQVSKKM